MFRIEKTTVRMTVKIPENTATIQRLYDYGTWFKLTEETITDTDRIINMIENMTQKNIWSYISDDDQKQHTSILYEYIN